MFGTLPVFHGADILGPAEDLGEIAQGGKAQKLGDLGQGQIRFCQQIFALLDPPGDHIIDGGYPVLPLEGVGEVVFVHVGFLRQKLQRQGILEMQVDVTLYRRALTVAGARLGFGGNGKGNAAHQPDDQDLHIGLTDILVAGVFLLHLPENVSQTGGYLHALKMIQNIKTVIGIFTGGKDDPVNAQHDILQRLGIQAYLGVGDIGVDDDQIVGIDRMELILDEKLALSTNNIKQLHVAVGVGHGMPVAAIGGAGDIQQFCSAADGKGQFFVHTVVASAHRIPPVSLKFLDILILYCRILLRAMAFFC